MRGQGPKGMLRMTARSRYRAALASKLLNTSSDDTTIQNINSYKSFFCCFSEMQEIRLPCMEESLLYAFGYQKIDGNLQFVDDKTTDRVSTVISLVRTWLLDEGTYCETAELCRDLLLCCNLSDVAIWEELLQHMLKENQKRSLILTLVMITNSTIYSTLLTSCNEEFLSHLYNTVIEVHYNGSSKVNQVIVLLR